jgi:hypothetical protein
MLHIYSMKVYMVSLVINFPTNDRQPRGMACICNQMIIAICSFTKRKILDALDTFLFQLLKL